MRAPTSTVAVLVVCACGALGLAVLAAGSPDDADLILLTSSLVAGTLTVAYYADRLLGEDPGR